jgi:hypothetical protein
VLDVDDNELLGEYPLVILNVVAISIIQGKPLLVDMVVVVIEPPPAVFETH